MKQRIKSIPIKILSQGISVFSKVDGVTYKVCVLDIYEHQAIVEVMDPVMIHEYKENRRLLNIGDLFSCNHAELWILDESLLEIAQDTVWDKLKSFWEKINSTF